MPKLVCQAGPTAGHEYVLSKDVTILGRQSSCDVQIQDEMSSRAHCQVRRDGKLYSLVDLGSRNGTQLNGKKVSERQLAFGDKIRVGKVEYLFVKEPGDVELKDLLSKYEILEKLGEGGMGIVYKANQRSMARVVALKILSPKYSSKPKFVEQFTREARAAGSLNHPNIIQVHDVGAENEIHYFSMEFVDGPTCMQVLKQNGPFPIDDALEIIRQTAKALEYAHAHRLIHQDIKPDNIMLGPNNIVKLADLGISKTFDEVEADDAPKKVMGTPHYMAPEAALGKKIDQKVDIYSLGATMYHLLSGKTPYHGSSPTEVLKHHVMDPLPPITEVKADVPPKVVALLERMLAKKPEERLQTATEVIEEIRKVAGAESGTERIGGETLILRRYAKGGPAAASIPTPASLTTGSRTPGGESTTPEGSESVGDERRLRQLNRVIVGVIVAVALVIAGMVARPLLAKPEPKPGPGTAEGPGSAPPPARDPVQAPATQPAGNDDQARKDKTAADLAELEAQLQRDGDKADVTAARKRLDELTENIDPDNLARAKAIGDKIEVIVQRRRTQQVMAAFDALSKDARKLASDHDYDNALNRLDAFKDRKDPAVKLGFDNLRRDIDGEKSHYLTELGKDVKQAIAAKDETRLKELRDRMPPPLLESQLEKDIIKALQDIAQERQKGYQSDLADGARDLAAWDFAALEKRWRDKRPPMGDTPPGQQYDQYHDAAQKLAAMVDAIGAKLRDRQMRYHGTLMGSGDPDLMDATIEQGLVLTPPSGGRVNLKWKSLPVDDVQKVLDTVLGKDGDAYKPALATLATAKGGAGGK